LQIAPVFDGFGAMRILASEAVADQGATVIARILVIDDDELLRQTVTTMLRSGGHEVVQAADGEDGLRRFGTNSIDLVLCDVFMPQMEGLETVRELRRLSPALPIISMTGSIPSAETGRLDPDFLRMSNEFGATRTLAKPFGTQTLLALVRECLESGGAPPPT
jgi:CheY-like chemotaxis protein